MSDYEKKVEDTKRYHRRVARRGRLYHAAVFGLMAGSALVIGGAAYFGSPIVLAIAAPVFLGAVIARRNFFTFG